MAAPEITILPINGLTVARQGQAIVAASFNALNLKEGDRRAVCYFPRESIWAGVHQPTPTKTHCPFKGEASYFDVGGENDGAWVYFEPIDTVASIKGHLAYSPAAAEIETISLPDPAPEATDILKFWLEETPPRLHFQQDDDLDLAIRSRFAGLHAQAAAGDLDHWQNHPDGALALLILLDQFSRNLHRGQAEAFAQDAQARRIAGLMISRGFDIALPEDRRAFVYLPFMHSEDLDDQNTSVALFGERLPGSTNMKYALSHREDIHRHGRFPYRDEAMGR